MQLPASACERQSVMLDHIESDGRHIEHLAPTTYPCVLCRQNRVAPFALLGQAMRRDLVRQLCLPDDSRNEFVFLAKPSDDGGLLELSLFMPSFASTASRRANSASMRRSLSVSDSCVKSGRGWLRWHGAMMR